MVRKREEMEPERVLREKRRDSTVAAPELEMTVGVEEATVTSTITVG